MPSDLPSMLKPATNQSSKANQISPCTNKLGTFKVYYMILFRELCKAFDLTSIGLLR